MLTNEDIYASISTPYDLLVSKEDYMGLIPATLAEIVDFHHIDVVMHSIPLNKPNRYAEIFSAMN